MAYQVLARKWRPHNFPEMVGQAHVVRALTNALENNRLHHAYLFTGTRGVGKTTIARILAKSLNCEKGITAYPCGECKTCVEIDAGRYIDLIEVDAASRTGVDDTRDLLENVQYAPSRGRYKVYLIDEVHMLTKQSFNALLKTLEEPPDHVKFLFATTDPQKLLPTVLSRCLQFNLKRIPIEQIIQHLTKIVETEGISYEIPALSLLAQSADGSLRDALSLLDQAIAYGAGALTTADVSSMLGTLDQEVIVNLVDTLAKNDTVALLNEIAHIAERNPDFMSLLADILSLLQKIALTQAVPATVNTFLTHQEAIARLAQQLSPEDVQLFYQIALLGRRDLPLNPDPRGGFEMLMLRMIAFRPATMHSFQRETVTNNPLSSHTTVSNLQYPSPSFSSPTQNQATTALGTEWTNMIQPLGLSGAIQQLAIHCELRKREGNMLHLILPSEHRVYRSKASALEESIKQHYGETFRINISIDQVTTETPAIQQQKVRENQQHYAETEVEKDPFIVAMKENFDAKIVSIKTTNKS